MADVFDALHSSRSRTPAASIDEVPARAGLYAVHGASKVWSELGLGEPPDDRPLYVGKAERSLQSRDLCGHFATGKTGSSTLRRSLAALLVDELQLVACPRNTTKPDGSANYGLEPDGDARLTAWMQDRLRLAVWLSPPGCVLDSVETEVLLELRPPLNIDKVDTPWRSELRVARARLAAASRIWRAG